MIILVQEFEIKSNALLSRENGDDPLTMQRGSLDDHVRSSSDLARQLVADDLEETLIRSFGQIEGDLVGDEDLFVGGKSGRGGAEGSEGGEEGGGEGGIVEVDEALGDGEVVGGREGSEELDEEMEDLILVDGTGTGDDSFSDDDLEDPFEQSGILGFVEDSFDDVESVGGEGDSEGLRGEG